MPKQYPPVIDYESYFSWSWYPLQEIRPEGGDEESKLANSRSSSNREVGQTHEHCAGTECGITKLTVKTAHAESTCYIDPKHEDIASDAERFGFAPGHETPSIQWKIDGVEFVTKARLELYGAGSSETIWSLDLDEAALGTGIKSDWDWKLDKRDVFPDDLLTVDHSPYLMRMVLVETKPGATVVEGGYEAWTYIDVSVASFEINWGSPSMIPSTRDDAVMSGERRAAVRDDEIKLLHALRADGNDEDGEDLKPLGGNAHEIAIPAHVFKEGHDDADDNDYVESERAWGNGPRIPLVAKVMVLDSKGNAVSAPLALGRANFLWNWEDTSNFESNPKHEEWSQNNSDDSKNFLKGVFEKYHDDSHGKDTDNCPLELGGKRGQGAEPVFPNQPGREPTDELEEGHFPFFVAECDDRETACLSYAWSKGKLAGCTGAVFQPSRIAGDRYRVTVCLAFSEDVAKAESGDELREICGNAHSVTGCLEVMRRIRLHYILRNGATAIDVNSTEALYREAAGTIIETQNQTLDENLYGDAIDTAIDVLDRDPVEVYNNRGLPFHLRFGLVLPQPVASPAIATRNEADMRTAVHDAFEHLDVQRLTLDAALDSDLNTRTEMIETGLGAKGILLQERGQDAYVLSLVGGTPFTVGNPVTTLASHKTANITACHQACWDLSISDDPTNTTEDERRVEVHVGGNSIHVTFGRFSTTLPTDKQERIRDFLLTEAANAATTATLRVILRSHIRTRSGVTERSTRSLDRLRVVHQLIWGFVDERTIPLRRFLKEDVEGMLGEHLYLRWSENWDRDNIERRATSRHFQLVNRLFARVLDGYLDALDAQDAEGDPTPEELLAAREERKGLYLFHLPGRDTRFNVRVMGAFLPDSSRRDRSVTYLATWPDANYQTQRADGSTINYKAEDHVGSHELAHALFIAHALEWTGRRPPRPLEPGQHSGTCIMNYDQDSDRFCGMCMLRLRGWKWAAIRDQMRFAVTDLRLVSVDTTSESRFYRGTDTSTARPEFCFAPETETIQIHYTIDDPDGRLTGGRLELCSGTDRTILWTKRLADGEWANGAHQIPWDGDVSGAPGFPQNFLTVAGSPYRLYLVLEGDGLGDPQLAWTNFDVRIGDVQFEWGQRGWLTASPTLGTGNVERDQQVFDALNDANDAANLGAAFPADGQDKRVYLESNRFYSDILEQMTNYAYEAHYAEWGDGPNIPIVAHLRIQGSGAAGPLDAPKSLEGLHAVWDCEDRAEEFSEDLAVVPGADVAVEQAEADFVTERDRLVSRGLPWGADAEEFEHRQMVSRALDGPFQNHYGRSWSEHVSLAATQDYETGGAATHAAGFNCHVDRGGKRGAGGRPLLPVQAGVAPTAAVPANSFPFRVQALATRVWAAESAIWTDGDAHCIGRTGVLFQPSIMGGDRYRLRLLLTHDVTDLDVHDTLAFEAAVASLPAPQRPATGNFEVWRRTNIAGYYKKKANATPALHLDMNPRGVLRMESVDLTDLQAFYDRSFIQLVLPTAGIAGVQAITQAEWNQAINDALPNIPAYVRATVDTNNDQWATTDDGVNFVDHTTFKVNMRAAYPAAALHGAGEDDFFKNLNPGDIDLFAQGGHSGGPIDQWSNGEKGEIWKARVWESAVNYGGVLRTAWGRVVFLAAMDAFLDNKHPAGRPDGIYVFQVNEFNHCPGRNPEGAGPNGFGVPFAAGHHASFITLCGNAYSADGNNSRTQTLAHEIAHTYSLNHPHAGYQGDPQKQHDKGTQIGCLLSYSFFLERVLCVGCQLRLRGWSWFKTNAAGVANEPRDRTIWRDHRANRRPGGAAPDDAHLDLLVQYHSHLLGAPIAKANLIG